jgi:hypothetical protein
LRLLGSVDRLGVKRSRGRCGRTVGHGYWKEGEQLAENTRRIHNPLPCLSESIIMPRSKRARPRTACSSVLRGRESRQGNMRWEGTVHQVVPPKFTAKRHRPFIRFVRNPPGVRRHQDKVWRDDREKVTAVVVAHSTDELGVLDSSSFVLRSLLCTRSFCPKLTIVPIQPQPSFITSHLTRFDFSFHCHTGPSST